MTDFYKCHAKHVDTKYLIENEWEIHKAICNANPLGWRATRKVVDEKEVGKVNIFPFDKKHEKLLETRYVPYDLEGITNQQLFEQLQLKIYNVGIYLPLKNEYNYHSLFDHFEFMEDFFDNLPFKRIKKILLMVLPAGCETVIHRDPLRDRFIYLRPDLSKDFFIFDETTKQKHYVNSLAAEWDFDAWHGADAKPYATYSIKVAGDIDV